MIILPECLRQRAAAPYLRCAKFILKMNLICYKSIVLKKGDDNE